MEFVFAENYCSWEEFRVEEDDQVRGKMKKNQLKNIIFQNVLKYNKSPQISNVPKYTPPYFRNT